MKPTSKYITIRRLLADMNQPAYRYRQIAEAIFKHRISEFERMTMLPMAVREALIETLGRRVCSVTPVLEKASRQVSKVLFAAADGERVEAVRLSYRGGWASYCVSTQCGCGFGCRFCATGTIGLKRNLTAEESASPSAPSSGRTSRRPAASCTGENRRREQDGGFAAKERQTRLRCCDAWPGPSSRLRGLRHLKSFWAKRKNRLTPSPELTYTFSNISDKTNRNYKWHLSTG
ncbi:hypothetical protein [Paenibacillus ginsengihumi]|jgi:hypothetical protein|uniref:hypothetical protein n=1 Tax=Paenibacillus ginsengihumi TaxID=431596 RepID=UPI000375E35D|nr:hypothetical protein [Paenibacillus ginsengihumi]